MNSLEHTYKQSELFSGVYYGKVISVSDPDNNDRAKVRVYSVYEIPIKKKDIPWAMRSSSYKAELGDEVSIRFIDGDVRTPVYLEKVTISKEQSDTLKNIYKDAIQNKKVNTPSNITVISKTIQVPTINDSEELGSSTKVELTVSKGVTEGEEDTDGAASEGLLESTDTKSEKVIKSTMHPTGTFIDIRDDGTVLIYGAKHVVTVTEEDSSGIIKGDYLLKVDGVVEIKATSIKLDATMVQIQGGALQVNGTVAPTGQGPFCGLPSCLFTGASHTGPIVVGT